MAFNILQVEYYNITVPGRIPDAANLISTIAATGVDFHAFKATPLEPDRTQFTFFAKENSKMTNGAQKAGLKLDGPYSALLIKGAEKSGALADIYENYLRQGFRLTRRVALPI